VIPDFNIKRDLPFREPVVVEFTPAKRGVFKFTCGMEMLEGKIVVR
jgi:plastocyanin domain-containing protein